jgi:hypothetical protein
MQLDAAEATGQARYLQPGETLETTAAFVVYGGLAEVAAVDRTGDIIVVR